MTGFARLLSATAALTALIAGATIAGPDTVGYPANYRTEFVNYLDVDRYDRKRVRKMYVSPDAHASAVAGQDLPDGTVLIMADHDAALDADGNPMLDANGRMMAQDPVLNIFVMEKNSAWNTANEDWDYAWYLPDGSPRPEANFDGCFACHSNRTGRDYTFTYWKYVSDGGN